MKRDLYTYIHYSNFENLFFSLCANNYSSKFLHGKVNDFKKFAISKKEIGIENQKTMQKI